MKSLIITLVFLISYPAVSKINIDRCGSNVIQEFISCYGKTNNYNISNSFAEAMLEPCFDCNSFNPSSTGPNKIEYNKCRMRYAKIMANHYASLNSYFAGKCEINKKSLAQTAQIRESDIRSTEPDAKCEYVGTQVIETFHPIKLEQEDADSLKCVKSKKIHKCIAQMRCLNTNSIIQADNLYDIFCYAPDGRCPSDALNCYTDKSFENEEIELKKKGYNVIRSNRSEAVK